AVLMSASVRAHMATRAPSPAKPIAQALPIPLLAAVTRTFFPLSPRSIDLSFSFAVGGDAQSLPDRRAPELCEGSDGKVDINDADDARRIRPRGGARRRRPRRRRRPLRRFRPSFRP